MLFDSFSNFATNVSKSIAIHVNYSFFPSHKEHCKMFENNILIVAKGPLREILGTNLVLQLKIPSASKMRKIWNLNIFFLCSPTRSTLDDSQLSCLWFTTNNFQLEKKHDLYRITRLHKQYFLTERSKQDKIR
jgi:hypothetical protein